MPKGIYSEHPIQNESIDRDGGLQLKIKRNIDNAKREEKNPINRDRRMFGETFEIVASEENRLNNPETSVQKDLRELIEKIFLEAELFLGTTHERPSKPDGVSVKFDGKGKLVIDEIVECKSSNNALVHGLEKKQPAKTLETIGNIVTILNKLKKGEDTAKIAPKDSDLSLDKRIKRDVELKIIKKQLIKISGDTNPITFSPEMVYRIIVPKGEELPSFNSHLLEESGYAVTLTVSRSNYSKKDIHEIINKII